MMNEKTLKVYKIYYVDSFDKNPNEFFIPAYTAEDAIRFAEEAGVKVNSIEECLFKEGFIFV